MPFDPSLSPGENPVAQQSSGGNDSGNDSGLGDLSVLSTVCPETTDGYIKMNVGEEEPVFVQADLPGGTFTVVTPASNPPALTAPVVSIYLWGNLVADYNNIAASGYDQGALEAPRIWFLLDTTNFAPGTYIVVIDFRCIGNDNLPRHFRRAIKVDVGL